MGGRSAAEQRRPAAAGLPSNVKGIKKTTPGRAAGRADSNQIQPTTARRDAFLPPRSPFGTGAGVFERITARGRGEDGRETRGTASLPRRPGCGPRGAAGGRAALWAASGSGAGASAGGKDPRDGGATQRQALPALAHPLRTAIAQVEATRATLLRVTRSTSRGARPTNPGSLRAGMGVRRGAESWGGNARAHLRPRPPRYLSVRAGAGLAPSTAARRTIPPRRRCVYVAHGGGAWATLDRRPSVQAVGGSAPGALLAPRAPGRRGGVAGSERGPGRSR